jgi:hypothetical protein
MADFDIGWQDRAIALSLQRSHLHPATPDISEAIPSSLRHLLFMG